MVDKSVLDIFVGEYKNNNGILNDIFLSTIFIGYTYYAEIREITIPKTEGKCGSQNQAFPSWVCALLQQHHLPGLHKATRTNLVKVYTSTYWLAKSVSCIPLNRPVSCFLGSVHQLGYFSSY